MIRTVKRAALRAGGVRDVTLIRVEMNRRAEEAQQRRGRQRGAWRALCAYAFVQADYVRRMMGREGQIMADHKLGKIAGNARRVQDFPEESFSPHVHAAGRFVQQQQVRLSGQSGGQQDAPQLPAGKLANAASRQMPGLYQRQHFKRAYARLGPDAEPERPSLAVQGKEFTDKQRQAAVCPQLLRHISDARRRPVFSRSEAYSAGIRHSADQTEQERCFSGAVRACQHG